MCPSRKLLEYLSMLRGGASPPISRQAFVPRDGLHVTSVNVIFKMINVTIRELSVPPGLGPCKHHISLGFSAASDSALPLPMMRVSDVVVIL